MFALSSSAASSTGQELALGQHTYLVLPHFPQCFVRMTQLSVHSQIFCMVLPSFNTVLLKEIVLVVN